MKTRKKYYRVDRRQIAFIKFIFEGYDGLLAMTTIDPGQGIISLNIAPGCEIEAAGVLEDLGKNVMLEKLSNFNPFSRAADLD